MLNIEATQPKFILSSLCTSQVAEDPTAGFQIAWEINPHMKVGASSLPLAFQEHDRFKAALQFAGATLCQVPFVKGAYDCVFMKDNALIIQKNNKKKALLGTPKTKERQCEQEHRAVALENLGVEVTHQASSYFEGGDLVVSTAHQIAFVGFGFRTDLTARAEIEEFLSFEVIALELVNAHFYHLDTAFNVVSTPEGCVVFACREAFTNASWEQLKHHSKVVAVVEIPSEEAMRFGLNWVEVNNTVILGSKVKTIARELRALGRHVVVTPLSQFQLAGGSAACLVAPVYNLDTVASKKSPGAEGKSLASQQVESAVSA
jgi:N-dimethylarginine dimethylaminohydrolase